MRLAEYVAEWLAANTSGRVYAVCGGAAMFLNDAICHHPKLKVIPMLHEQAAAFAADGDYRVGRKVSTVMVTAGPGGTNALTGVASAYVDYIPMIVLAGQVDSRTMHKPFQRQRGMNELAMSAIVAPMVLTSAQIVNADMVPLLAIATKRGPVWIDVPIDTQSCEVGNPSIFEDTRTPFRAKSIPEAWAMLADAERPVVIIGNGIHLSGAEGAVAKLADNFRIPIVSSWNASDVLPTAHQSYIGRVGLYGDRAANLAMQNADLVLAVGTRLSIPMIGHDPKAFAPKAKKIIVDTDGGELAAKDYKVDLPIQADAWSFLTLLCEQGADAKLAIGPWRTQCAEWKKQHRIPIEGFRYPYEGLNVYGVIGCLAKSMRKDAIVVADVGSGAYAALQALPMKSGQRMFHSGGVGSMGYALPAAIGAALAADDPKRRVVCIAGDGGLMMNLQELATLAHLRLPVDVMVFCNDGYMTMRSTQERHFGRQSISGIPSGLPVPKSWQMAGICSAFRIPTEVITTYEALTDAMSQVRTGARIFILKMDPNQEIEPRVQSRVEGDKIIPGRLEDMWPPIEQRMETVA